MLKGKPQQKKKEASTHVVEPVEHGGSHVLLLASRLLLIAHSCHHHLAHYVPQNPDDLPLVLHDDIVRIDAEKDDILLLVQITKTEADVFQLVEGQARGNDVFSQLGLETQLDQVHQQNTVREVLSEQKNN